MDDLAAHARKPTSLMNATTTPLLDGHPAIKLAEPFSKILATALALTIVALIASFDYATGDFSMALFYVAPVALATWYAGRLSGWCIALTSAAAWLATDLPLSHRYEHPLIPYWNAAIFALIYGAIVQLLALLQSFQRELEKRIAERSAALARANEDLLTSQMRLVEAAKLESIGRLAAGLAHEVKNPLMTINLVADYLAETTRTGAADGAALVQDLRAAVQQANGVISEMLDFARPAPLALQSECFHTVAERAVSFVKREANRKHLRIEPQWCEPAPVVLLDRNKMQQVLVNLLLNAIHATPDGGTLTLRSRIEGDQFVAEIDDTGTGLAAAPAAKLFEPFFTTKPPGQGTGLGLTVARQIVQLHGGDLRLENRPDGRGARATMRLPLSDEQEGAGWTDRALRVERTVAVFEECANDVR
jgi:signal transduction histidine kinase